MKNDYVNVFCRKTRLEYPKGCIIAKAKITDCIYVDDDFRKKFIPENPNVYKGLNKTE